MSQKQKLLDLLSDGEWHSNVDILNKLHIWRVAARIYDLIKDGHDIETKNGEGSRYLYRLIQLQQSLI